MDLPTTQLNSHCTAVLYRRYVHLHFQLHLLSSYYDTSTHMQEIGQCEEYSHYDTLKIKLFLHNIGMSVHCTQYTYLIPSYVRTENMLGWHEWSALQSVTVWRSTGNNISGNYFCCYLKKNYFGISGRRYSRLPLSGQLTTTLVVTISAVISSPPHFFFSVATFSQKECSDQKTY